MLWMMEFKNKSATLLFLRLRMLRQADKWLWYNHVWLLTFHTHAYINNYLILDWRNIYTYLR